VAHPAESVEMSVDQIRQRGIPKTREVGNRAFVGDDGKVNPGFFESGLKFGGTLAGLF
jgi:hypothetical protein